MVLNIVLTLCQRDSGGATRFLRRHLSRISISAAASRPECRRSPSIGPRWRNCARHPSHTTGRAVFRIQRLNAAALTWPQDATVFRHASYFGFFGDVRKGAPLPPTPQTYGGCTAQVRVGQPGVVTAVVTPRRCGRLTGSFSVHHLALFFRSSAVRSARLSPRFNRYFGLC